MNTDAKFPKAGLNAFNYAGDISIPKLITTDRKLYEKLRDTDIIKILVTIQVLR